MPLPAVLLLALIAVPLLEIYLLVVVGSIIGAGPTMLAVVVMAILGTLLLRAQGLATVRRLQQTLERGELPAAEILEGLILVITAVLLLTPGFFTDCMAVVFLVPAVRAAIARRLLRHLVVRGKLGSREASGQPGRVIDGEYRREDPP